jgi:hypothetical protein
MTNYTRALFLTDWDHRSAGHLPAVVSPDR